MAQKDRREADAEQVFLREPSLGRVLPLAARSPIHTFTE
jgi:hypothetical protein